MKCCEERKLAAQLADAAGATQTRATIENQGFEEIFKTAANECCEKGGVNVLINNVLFGF